jgi:hypothetical protein
MALFRVIFLPEDCTIPASIPVVYLSVLEVKAVNIFMTYRISNEVFVV